MDEIKSFEDFIRNEKGRRDYLVFVSHDTLKINKYMNAFSKESNDLYFLLNFNNLMFSNCYNPLLFEDGYDNGIYKLCNFICNRYFGKISPEELLLRSIVLYLLYHRPVEERNFLSVLKLLHAGESFRLNPKNGSPLDDIFDEVYKKNCNSHDVEDYCAFKSYPVETQKKAFANLINLLNVLEAGENKNFLIYNEMLHIYDHSDATFVCLPQSQDKTFISFLPYIYLYQCLDYLNSSDAYNWCSFNSTFNIKICFDETVDINIVKDIEKNIFAFREKVSFVNISKIPIENEDNTNLICTFDNYEKYNNVSTSQEARKILEENINKIPESYELNDILKKIQKNNKRKKKNKR